MLDRATVWSSSRANYSLRMRRYFRTMRRIRCLSFAAVASVALSCAVARASPDRPAWMIGKWGLMPPSGKPDSAACPEAEFYGSNGYVVYPGGGVDRWWTEDDVLVRITVEPMPGGPQSKVRQSSRLRFKRLKNGNLFFRQPDWSSQIFRCGETPKEWEYQPRR